MHETESMQSVKNEEKRLSIRRTSYFWDLRSFQMFTGPLLK